MQTLCFPGSDVIFSRDWKEEWQRRMSGRERGKQKMREEKYI